MFIKDIYFEKMDLDLFMITEVENKRFVLVSKDLPVYHEAFIYLVDYDDIDKEELAEIIKPEERYIFTQGLNLEPQKIYDMYKRKQNLNIENSLYDNDIEEISKYLKKIEDSYYEEDEDDIFTAN